MEIDITKYLGSTGREFASREFQGKPARVVTLTRSFATDQDNLWDALTNPDRLPTWFLPITGGTNPGDRYQLEGNAGGEILLCQPKNRFEITWEFDGQVSWVHVSLTPSGQGTDFKLEHLAHIPEDDSFWTQYGPGATGIGWDLGLIGLDLHITTGQPNNADEFMAWMMGPQGKEFSIGSSTAWGQAAIKGGTPEETALKAVANSTAFFTGAEQPED